MIRFVLAVASISAFLTWWGWFLVVYLPENRRMWKRIREERQR